MITYKLTNMIDSNTLFNRINAITTTNSKKQISNIISPPYYINLTPTTNTSEYVRRMNIQSIPRPEKELNSFGNFIVKLRRQMNNIGNETPFEEVASKYNLDGIDINPRRIKITRLEEKLAIQASQSSLLKGYNSLILSRYTKKTERMKSFALWFAEAMIECNSEIDEINFEVYEGAFFYRYNKSYWVRKEPLTSESKISIIKQDLDNVVLKLYKHLFETTCKEFEELSQQTSNYKKTPDNVQSNVINNMKFEYLN